MHAPKSPKRGRRVSRKITRTQEDYLLARFGDMLEKDIAQLEITYLGLKERVVEFGFG